MKFRIPVSVAILVCACNFVLAGEKSPLTTKTDFKNMPPGEAMAVLQEAAKIEVKIPGHKSGEDINIREHIANCNGKGEAGASVPRESHCIWSVHAGLDNPSILLFDMEALFRGCGVYAPSSQSDESYDGTSCGILGRVFYTIGNIATARAIWEHAPGCYVFDSPAHRVNGCMKYIVKPSMDMRDLPYSLSMDNNFPKGNAIAAYESAPDTLLQLARQACTPDRRMWEPEIAPDRSSCEFLAGRGKNVDMAAVESQEAKTKQARKEQADQDRSERAERRQESNARFNAVIGAMQSMPGASDPNAVVNAGNQQAAAIRAVGDADALQQQAAAQQRLTAQQDAQLAAHQLVAGQQAASQNASSGTPSGSTRNSGGNTSATAGQYAASLSATCIRGFWDPKFYNWLSFENICGQSVHLSFIATSANDTFGMSSTDIAPGQASNTGWSQDEVNRKGGFTLFVCPAGYVAVDASTDQSVSRPNRDYRCKKW
jgi:hypothetical protein